MFLGTIYTKKRFNTFQMEDQMPELSKAERINQARTLYNNRKVDRPVQITSPSNEHIVGWDWPKVDEVTLAEFDEYDQEE